MSKKAIVISVLVPILIIALVFLAILGVNEGFTYLIRYSNTHCKGEKFATAEEAISAMEASEMERSDYDLDFCPPYDIVYTFEYEDNTIVFYSYSKFFDSEVATDSYAVQILKRNDDGTLSFAGGFIDFEMREPKEDDEYYYTNIKTQKGEKSLSILYLPKDSDKDIYVDGVKAEKILVSIENQEFYICYAISHRDTFLKFLFTPIGKRHQIEIK